MTNRKKKILIADDDMGILEMLQMMLEDEGYAVETTFNGKKTVEEVKNHLPDVILLDIWMSGVDGRTICKKLKSQPATKHIPIIMCSANKDTETIAKESGADDFISKPFEIDTLLTMIKRYT